MINPAALPEYLRVSSLVAGLLDDLMEEVDPEETEYPDLHTLLKHYTHVTAELYGQLPLSIQPPESDHAEI